MTFEEASRYVSFVVDDALNGRELNRDPLAIVDHHSVLVGWQCGFEPLFVAVNSYLEVVIDDDEAIEFATDYLRERNWFPDPNADNFADYIIRHSGNSNPKHEGDRPREMTLPLSSSQEPN